MNSEVTARGTRRKLLEPSPSISQSTGSSATPSLDGRMTVCKGQTVYVYTSDNAWEEAIITGVDHSKKTVLARLETSYKVVQCSQNDILLRSEQSLYDCTNLTHVTPVHEASVLACLYERFTTCKYYTNAGTTVIAVNPFCDVSYLYTPEQIKAYHDKNKDLPPHIYPIAELAYTNLMREMGCHRQSIVINGESGAGKTETAKHLLKYLTTVSSVPAKESSAYRGRKIEQRILDSNPILEAFGNAATPRNNNSSRFGKFIELQFTRTGHMKGGTIQTYLLEKTRLVHQGSGENNFHVFYQITSMSPEDHRHPNWLLNIKKEIAGTSFSGVPCNQDYTENSDIMETLDAMTDIGVSQNHQNAIVEVLLAILYLVNLQFIPLSDDSSGLDRKLGLLDIYGFEAFASNSLEQLCINYANERLQQHYVSNFLQHLQTEYEDECITWIPISVNDNQSCVDLLDGRLSIFSILNEEVYMNRKINDATLNDRILKLCMPFTFHLRPARLPASGVSCFVVQHYAGEVVYSAHNLITKNKDDIPEDLVRLLSVSENPFVQELFANLVNTDSPGKKKKTVLIKFKSSLDTLMRSLEESDIHYIRCVKPNESNSASKFEPPFVLGQLRACGTVETINICRHGFTARMPYPEFIQRYSIILRKMPTHTANSSQGEASHLSVWVSLDALLMQQINLAKSPNPTPTKRHRRRSGLTQHDHARKVCGAVLQAVLGDQNKESLTTQFGRTKIFLLENQLELLEHARMEVINDYASVLQSAWKCFCCRRRFRQHMAAFRIQRAWAAHLTRLQFLQYKKAALTIQRAWATCMARRHFLNLKEAALVIQKTWATCKVRRPFLKLKEAACKIENAWITHLARKRFLLLKEAANKIQQAWSAHLARRRFLQAKRAALVQQQYTRQKLRKQQQQQDYIKVVKGKLQSPLFTPHDSVLVPAASKLCSLSVECDAPPLSTDTVDFPQDLDLSGNLSDDSGVMLQDPRHQESPARSEADSQVDELEPPQKKKHLAKTPIKFAELHGFHLGDGIISRYGIPTHGVRFHTRASVLKYGHIMNRRDLPKGLSDVLPQGASDSPTRM
ncbi:hypothetical protein C0Q70_08369 [Pomacea canaliculata]|uniref:Myosin motor domain-containing protein n=1 Tax=Pomacea canaliculata TaxID=400727 RepID=A0A2T7PHM9_POMCA|nr:hypothetical protein C0Q70_08369 [Pomacea canaliculata]